MSQIAFNQTVRLMHDTDAQTPLETLKSLKAHPLPKGDDQFSTILRDTLALFIGGRDMTPAALEQNLAVSLGADCMTCKFDDVAKTLNAAGFNDTDNRAMQSVLTRMAAGVYLDDLIKIVEQKKAFSVKPPTPLTWG